MTKRDLIDEVVRLYPQYSRRDAEVIVNAVFASMASTLRSGGRIEIRDSGVSSSNSGKGARDVTRAPAVSCRSPPKRVAVLQSRQRAAAAGGRQTAPAGSPCRTRKFDSACGCSGRLGAWPTLVSRGRLGVFSARRWQPPIAGRPRSRPGTGDRHAQQVSLQQWTSARAPRRHAAHTSASCQRMNFAPLMDRVHRTATVLSEAVRPRASTWA